MITELVDLLKSGETPEPETTLEKLEQKNTENASERHILEFEEDYDSKILITRIVTEFGVSLATCGGVQILLMTSFKAASAVFSSIPLSLLTVGVNLGSAVVTSDNRRKIGYKLTLGGCKFLVNTAINGNVAWFANQEIQNTKQSVETLKAEIAAYENGYKQQPGLPLESILIGSILIGLVLIGLKRK
jgi:hypothetical protein